MKEEIRALVDYRINRAMEAFVEAEILLRENKFRGSLNRLYYACFYGVNALLASKNLNATKHSGVIALFHREFVKTQRFPRESAKIIDMLFDLRMKGDYKDFTEISEEIVEEFVPAVKKFIEKIQMLLA